MRRTLALALLVACGGPIEETLVDELRVVAAIPSTPEARPGEAVQVQVVVVEPTGQPVDVLVWLCTAAGPPGTPCVEAASDGSVTVARGVVGEVQASLQVSALLAGALSDALPEVPASLWVLACEPGLCPIIDEAAQAPEVGSPAHEALFAQLADPAAALRDLPLQGVAASRRTLVVSDRSDGERNTNPVVSGTLDSRSVAPAAELALTLDVADDQVDGIAFGYATHGGFTAIESPVIDGSVELIWVAPEEIPALPVSLFVVVQDGLGGEGLWRGSVRVEDPR